MILGELLSKKSKNNFNTLENRFREVHKDSYDYSKSIYLGTHQKIEIWCNNHQEYFWQTPKAHLKGAGCILCGYLIKNNKLKKPFNSFKEQANLVHNNKYEYIESTYINAHNHLDIICPIHGQFKQLGSSHLSGKGCFKCKTTIYSPNIKPYSMFKEQANLVHNNKYEYIESTYINTKTKMQIICPIHGEFKQKPYSHLEGHGCSKCASAEINKKYYAVKTVLYYIKLELEDAYYYKIGITKRSISKRYSSLYKYPHIKGYEIIASKEYPNGYSAYHIEQKILATFKEFRTKDSVLVGNGNSEVFDIDIYQNIQHHFL